jgi:hypothetical protein
MEGAGEGLFGTRDRQRRTSPYACEHGMPCFEVIKQQIFAIII